jgi:SagB-type dehydrogenase family enzyme
VVNRRILIVAVLIVIVAVSVVYYWYWVRVPGGVVIEGETILLPKPAKRGVMSVEEAIQRRRSIRSFTEAPISLNDLSQLLWAAQGITDEVRGFRAAPSAGALYPLELYVAVGEKGVIKRDGEYLKAGIYHYRPKDHSITFVLEGDLRGDLALAALGQMFIADAPIVMVITAVYERTTARYGDRGVRYVHMEVGHAAQNVYLQSVALDLGTVVIGAFHDSRVKEILRLGKESPLYLMPIGHPR